MKIARNTGVVLILFGIALLFWSIFNGDGGAAIIIIFPVFYSHGIYGALGALLIFFGTFLMFISPLIDSVSVYENTSVNSNHYEKLKTENENTVERKAKYGGIILIGPIPIIFGTDKNQAKYAAIGGIILILSVMLFLMMGYL